MNDVLYAYYQECRQTMPVDATLVFLESHNGMELAGNLFAIARELTTQPAYQHLRICVCCLQDHLRSLQALCAYYGMQRITFVIRESREYLEVLATAGTLFTDVAFHPLFLKRSGQRCIATWHGTPLKTLGFDYMADEYVVGNQKRGFTLADLLIMPNVYTWERIEHSYQLEGMVHARIVYGGSPRNSVFFDEERRNALRHSLGVADKRVIAYLPTWRGKVIDVDARAQSEQLQDLLEEIDDRLDDDMVLWAKLHRLNHQQLQLGHLRHIVAFPQGLDTYDVLNAADVLVSDYSSVLFDFACTRRKIVLFCYDYRQYVRQRGCYFDPAQLPFPLCTDVDSLVDALRSPDGWEDAAFVQRFVAHDSLHACRNLCAHIFGGPKLHEVRQPVDPTRRVLCFVGELNKGKETDALFHYLRETFGADRCFITYMNHLFKTHYERLWQFPFACQVPMYMYQGYYAHFLPRERIALEKIRRSIAEGKEVDAAAEETLAEQGRREYRRYLYENTYDRFVRCGGLDIESLKWFAVFSGEKWLILQENMLEKAGRHPEYAYFLKRAMGRADRIGYANEALARKSVRLLGSFSCQQQILSLYPDETEGM